MNSLARFGASKRSLTLIELLLVLMILAALAASAASFVEESDDQFRYQDTQNRLVKVREGILGSGASGPPRREGFVVDTGRLPVEVGDLLRNDGGFPVWAIDDGNDPTGALATLRGGDSPTGLGYGWRGPYLQALPRASDGTRVFPDGWGNAFDDTDRNFGWLWNMSSSGDLSLKSKGRGGIVDSSPPPSDLYARDYPSSPSGGPANYLVARGDYAVLVRGLRVEVEALASTGTPPPPSSVRLRLRYFGYVDVATGAVSLTGGTGTERRQITLLSDAKNLSPGNVTPLVFTFNEVTGAPTDTPEFIPMGPKALDLVDGATGHQAYTSGPAGPTPTHPSRSDVTHLDLRPGASATQRVPTTFEVN